MCRKRKGFTLIELLVVIAIIGILIALLVPAVQKVRAAVARTQCQNNVKQWTMALHSFHGVWRRFPPGGAIDQPPFGTSPNGASWGSSWLVYLLPYIEQDAMYNKFVFNGGSGWGANNNYTVANNSKITLLQCPASVLPKMCITNPGGSTGTQTSNYVGVAGAETRSGTSIITTPAYTDSRVNGPGGGSAGCCSAGVQAGNGVLFANGQTTLTDITDGTSNVLAIGEQSDWIITQNGTKVDWRSSGMHGWQMGSFSAGIPPNYSSGSDGRSFNIITTRYKVNQNTGWVDSPGNCGTTGVCDNATANRPFNSPHGGGVNAGFCDGSVRWLTDTMSLSLLGLMSVRDDGQNFPAEEQP